MRLRPTSCATFGLPFLLFLAACTRQGQGESCNVYGADCQSPLVCVATPGQELGLCCQLNSQCGGTQTGLMIQQGDDDASRSAPADAPNDVPSADAADDVPSADATDDVPSADAADDVPSADAPADSKPDAASDAMPAVDAGEGG
jgi:hypothetical protein